MDNPNNLKVGDVICVETAWEDEAGQYHDEYAEIKGIAENGDMDLHFYEASEDVNDFLKDAEHFAKDYKAE